MVVFAVIMVTVNFAIAQEKENELKVMSICRFVPRFSISDM